MEVLYLLIPIALLVVAGIVIVLSWAVQSGQFDDLDSPAHRILMEDDPDDRSPERDAVQGEREASAPPRRPAITRGHDTD